MVLASCPAFAIAPRILQVYGKRRFAIDVLTRRKRIQHDLLVLVGRRGDKDGLNGLVVQYLAVVVVERNAGAFQNIRGLLDEDRSLIGVANGDNGSARSHFCESAQNRLPLKTGADQGTVDGRGFGLVRFRRARL